MNIAHPDAIWLIPPILAVAFLLWVLWNLIKDEEKQRSNAHAVHPLLICTSADRDFRTSSTAAWDVQSASATAARPLAKIART